MYDLSQVSVCLCTWLDVSLQLIWSAITSYFEFWLGEGQGSVMLGDEIYVIYNARHLSLHKACKILQKAWKIDSKESTKSVLDACKIFC